MSNIDLGAQTDTCKISPPPAANDGPSNAKPAIVDATSRCAQKIIHHIENGLPPAQAADLCLVPQATLDEWICENPQFHAQVRKAEARDIEKTFAKIMRGRRNWRFHIWKLERRYPHIFSAHPGDHEDPYDPIHGSHAFNHDMNQASAFSAGVQSNNRTTNGQIKS